MPSLDSILGMQKRFGFTAKALPSDTFAVVDLVGNEAISRLYEFTLTLVSENPALVFETVLNQPATLMIFPRTDAPQPVSYHGLVTHLEQAHQIGSYTVYRAMLAPRLWGLSRDRMSEVYVEQTTPQVIARKLHEHGLASQDYELRLTSPYKSWSYLCQYEETDLDFIARLMERDGIYFYFEQGPEREKLILVDAQTGQPASVRAVPYRPAASLETSVSEESLQAWVCRQQVPPQRVVLQDYNYRTASLALLAPAEVSPSGQGEVRRYGEAFETLEEGQALATIRAQELACRQQMFQGEGTATGLRAGFCMALQSHYRADYNGRYLVTEVRHEGAQAGTLLAGLEAAGGAAGPAREDFYRSACTAIPAHVQFRPERLTPKPRVHGTMTAFVDAEGAGQYAELDAHGRYKVQVPFDKTDKGAGKASTWVRMATPYAGRDHGMHLPLHKGTEVLLTFQDGDPDRPVIASAVPNSLTSSVVNRENQTGATIRSASGNTLHFQDAEGHSRMVMSSGSGGSHFIMGQGSPDQTTTSTFYAANLAGATMAHLSAQHSSMTINGWSASVGSYVGPLLDILMKSTSAAAVGTLTGKMSDAGIPSVVATGIEGAMDIVMSLLISKALTQVLIKRHIAELTGNPALFIEPAKIGILLGRGGSGGEYGSIQLKGRMQLKPPFLGPPKPDIVIGTVDGLIALTANNINAQASNDFVAGGKTALLSGESLVRVTGENQVSVMAGKTALLSGESQVLVASNTSSVTLRPNVIKLRMAEAELITLTPDGITLKAGASSITLTPDGITLKAGASSITLTPDGITLKAGASSITITPTGITL